MTTIAVLAATAGLLLVVAALVVRARDRRARLLELLELPYAEEEVEDVDHLAEHTGLLEPGVGAVGAVLDRLEVGDRIAARAGARSHPAATRRGRAGRCGRRRRPRACGAPR